MIKSQPKVDNHIDDEEEIIQFDDNMKYLVLFHFQ